MTRKLNPRERIAKARINLLTDYPFFGSLAMQLLPREVPKDSPIKVPTMAVDLYGNLMYNPEFVKKLDDRTLKVAIAHECMHIAMRHLERLGSRRPFLWNVATDATINEVLDEAFGVPKDWVLIPEMSKKSAEEIYDWLLMKAKEGKGSFGSSWDTHIYGRRRGQGQGGSNKNGKTPIQDSPFKLPGQKPLDPTRMVREAYNFAKRQGNVPAGIKRLFKDILEPVMNWKDILRKFIVSTLPHDFTYLRPSKRSYSAGFYMPRVVRETVDIIIGVDSSGSISDREYAEFLTEVYGMVKQFENLRATLLVCDTEISEVKEIDNNFDPYSVEGRGYGGTSSLPVYKWIEENKNNNIKLLVYFTDGWIDIPREEKPFHTLWIITPNGRTDEVERMSNATVIQIPRRERD